MMTRRTLDLDRAGEWLCRQGTFLLVAVYAASKTAERLLAGRAWQTFGRLDLAVLLGAAGAITAITRSLLARERARWGARDGARRAAALHEAENRAAARVARAVAREFAQPLSGALGYSELLMARAHDLPAADRRELQGLREGILQMDHLLQALRQTIDQTWAGSGEGCVADAVERCVAGPRPRFLVHGSIAVMQGTGPRP